MDSTSQVIVLNFASIIALIINFFIPLLVALVTKKVTPGWVQAIILMFFTALNNFLVQLPDQIHGYPWKTAIVSAFISFAVAIAAHFGLWKQTTLQAKILAFPQSIKAEKKAA